MNEDPDLNPVFQYKNTLTIRTYCKNQTAETS